MKKHFGLPKCFFMGRQSGLVMVDFKFFLTIIFALSAITNKVLKEKSQIISLSLWYSRFFVIVFVLCICVLVIVDIYIFGLCVYVNMSNPVLCSASGDRRLKHISPRLGKPASLFTDSLLESSEQVRYDATRLKILLLYQL